MQNPYVFKFAIEAVNPEGLRTTVVGSDLFVFGSDKPAEEFLPELLGSLTPVLGSISAEVERSLHRQPEGDEVG